MSRVRRRTNQKDDIIRPDILCVSRLCREGGDRITDTLRRHLAHEQDMPGPTEARHIDHDRCEELVEFCQPRVEVAEPIIPGVVLRKLPLRDLFIKTHERFGDLQPLRCGPGDGQFCRDKRPSSNRCSSEPRPMR